MDAVSRGAPFHKANLFCGFLRRPGQEESPPCWPGLQVSVPEPKALTVHLALPVHLHVTPPAPAMLASTVPSEAKATSPDPPIDTFRPGRGP